MSYVMHVIHPDGTIVSTTWAKKPKLDPDIYAAVESDIAQMVPEFTTYEFAGKRVRCEVWADENGKPKGRPFNSFATRAWREAAGELYGMRLVGPIAVIHKV